MSVSASIQKIDNRIFLKGEHQAALAYLGQLSLSEPAPAELAAQAAILISQVLQVEHALFWELAFDRQSLARLAGQGEAESSAVLSQTAVHLTSAEGLTLSSPGPILIDRSGEETIVISCDPNSNPGVKHGMSVRIGTLEKPYGIIQVFSEDRQFFSWNDLYFLQGVASIVGLALNQERCQQPVNIHPKPRSAVQSGYLEWDRYEIKNRLVESRERERLRLAQDLHDVPIQDLYGMIYQLDDLREVIKDPESQKVVDECDHTLHRVVDSLRTICRELRPPSLSPFGLEVAIRDHMEKFRDQNPNINVTLELMPDKQVLTDSMRLTLFRIYQQAIHNVARHSEATEAHVRFQWNEERVTLEVQDNGMGFEVPENWVDLVQDEHFGLLGIAERVESIRGKLEIRSTLGSGTLVRVMAPYTHRDLG